MSSNETKRDKLQMVDLEKSLLLLFVSYLWFFLLPHPFPPFFGASLRPFFALSLSLSLLAPGNQRSLYLGSIGTIPKHTERHPSALPFFGSFEHQLLLFISVSRAQAFQGRPAFVGGTWEGNKNKGTFAHVYSNMQANSVNVHTHLSKYAIKNHSHQHDSIYDEVIIL